jgi:CheY-like chemotaxis protein/CRP-like cAMP-binding protein
MNRPSSVIGSPGHGVLDGLRVLLVDEDMQSRKIVEHMLANRGALVTTAFDTSQALYRFAAWPPDLIVADVSPPSTKGLAVIQSVRQLPVERGGKTPAIAVSPPVRTDDSFTARESGFQAHLVKPVSPDVLVSTVQRLQEQIATARRIREEAKALRSELVERRITLQDRRARLRDERERGSTLSLRGPAFEADTSLRDREAARDHLPLANRIFKALSSEDANRLRAKMEVVNLEARNSLYFLGDRVSHVYFPETAVISLLCVLPEGDTVELGVVGFDGVVGAARSTGDLTVRLQPFVQVGGRAFRMQSSCFDREFDAVAAFSHAIRQYQNTLFNYAARVVACNRFHALEQRLSRWLLSIHDRAGSDELSVTHETISNALGVRRAGITVELGELQRMHAIASSRARLVILDRGVLEARSCACYTPVED